MKASRGHGPVIGLVLVLCAMAACESQPVARRLPDAEPIPETAGGPETVYLELATSYLEQGQPYAALTNARKAIAVSPDNSEARIVKAMAESRLGYAEDAEKTLRTLLHHEPENPYAANAYGTFLCTERRYAEAMTQFDRAAANPHNQAPWVALTNAGLCYREQGKSSEATERLQKALSRNTRFAPALLALARLHYDQQRAAEAQAYIRRYFEVAAPDPESLMLAYRIEKSLGHTRAAESYALMLRSRFPDSPQAYTLPGL